MAVKDRKTINSEEVGFDNSKSLSDLPKSAREIFHILQTNGALKPNEIRNYTGLSNRTIRYALKILIDDARIIRIPDLHDLRTHYYRIN